MQYIREEEEKKDSSSFDPVKQYNYLVNLFQGPIFRYKETSSTENGISMMRYFPYGEYGYFQIELDKTSMVVDMPVIKHNERMPFNDDDYANTNSIFRAKINFITPQNINSSTLKLPWSHTSNAFDFQNEPDEILDECLTSWADHFKVYNLYCDTPGSEVDKTLAVANSVGVSRIEIMKLKREFGILSHEEIGDDDMIGLM